jgi:hypothetical protein
VDVGVTAEVNPGKELKTEVLPKISELLPIAVLAMALLSWALDVTVTEEIDEERKSDRKEDAGDGVGVAVRRLVGVRDVKDCCGVEVAIVV